jgi:hypothetical protein
MMLILAVFFLGIDSLFGIVVRWLLAGLKPAASFGT